MSNEGILKLVLTIVLSVAVLTFIVVSIILSKKRGTKVSTKFMTRTAIFAALSTILYVVPFLKFRLPFFPSFLEVHLDEIPLLMAGFAYGPWSGIFALLIKTIIKLPLSTTMCVGELADFVYSLFFVVPAALFYKKHRNFVGALIALLIGMISQIIAASFITTFLILDFYMFVMGLPREAIIGAIQKAGIMIDDLTWPFFIMVGVPFNAFKDAIVVIVTILLYKRFKIILEKIAS
ncbi:MAG: ECF transporter S component [Bacilli bacterium]|nr:ECF transporter S component [Bacilli bacterium]